MNLIPGSSSLADYVTETDEINFSHPAITAISDEFAHAAHHEIEFAKTAFEFVRDRIAHSWDIQSSRITCKASDVLLYKEGICYAKSMLLSALLRSQGIPAGFCYQRLTLGDTPDTGYVIHALNAVYFRSLETWVRLDARGNKKGINAQFSLEQEQLAFPIRMEYGEIDYPIIYVHPHPATLAALQGSQDCMIMYQTGLPSHL